MVDTTLNRCGVLMYTNKAANAASSLMPIHTQNTHMDALMRTCIETAIQLQSTKGFPTFGTIHTSEHSAHPHPHTAAQEAMQPTPTTHCHPSSSQKTMTHTIDFPIPTMHSSAPLTHGLKQTVDNNLFPQKRLRYADNLLSQPFPQPPAKPPLAPLTMDSPESV